MNSIMPAAATLTVLANRNTGLLVQFAVDDGHTIVIVAECRRCGASLEWVFGIDHEYRSMRQYLRGEIPLEEVDNQSPSESDEIVEAILSGGICVACLETTNPTLFL